jgi:hypothetical protein
MRRQADIAQTGQAAQAVGAGAFGGTREGVQRAETERGIQDLMQQRIMQDYANNYAQAQQAAMQGFESQQQRQLAGGQALGQAGMQFANLGQGIGGLTAQQAGVDINKASALGSSWRPDGLSWYSVRRTWSGYTAARRGRHRPVDGSRWSRTSK